MDDTKGDRKNSPSLSSSGSTPVSEGIEVYMDHIEVKVQYKDDPLPNQPYPLKAPSGIREHLHPELGPYVHTPTVFKSKNGQISIGGMDHLSTNGRRLLLAQMGQPMPHAKRRKKIAIATDNQLTDGERLDLDVRRKSLRPWDWQLRTCQELVRTCRDIYSNGLLKDAYLKRIDQPYPFPLRVNVIEFYCEVKIADRDNVIKDIGRAISESLRFGSPIRTDEGVKGREYYCRWNATIKDQRGKERAVAVKSYTKGSYQRIEIQFKCITTEVSAPNDVNSIFNRLWELGRLADRVLNEVVAGIDTLPEGIDPKELRDAVATYCRGTQTNRFDFLIDELIRFGTYCNANRKGRGQDIGNSVKNLLKSDGILETVDNPELGFVPADGRSSNVSLRPDWKEQAAKKRMQDQLKRRKAHESGRIAPHKRHVRRFGSSLVFYVDSSGDLSWITPSPIELTVCSHMLKGFEFVSVSADQTWQ